MEPKGMRMQLQSTSNTSNLARLDALLNERIVASASNAEVRAAWAEKVLAKRRLESVPPADVERVAGQLLTALAGVAV